MKENIVYEQFIKNIINERGQWNIEVRYSERGCERHHILPRCMGGLPDKLNWQHHSNIIWLYPQEHFIAHQLLAREYSNNIGLVAAFWGMCNKNSSCNEQYIYTSEEYEEARSLAANELRKHAVELWNIKSEEERQQLTLKRQRGRDNKSEEDRAEWFKSIGESNKNRSDEEKEVTKIKKQTTWRNRTEEQREATLLKRRNTIKNNPEIEINRKLREKETKLNRTNEQKLESLNKLRNTLANKSEESKKASELKRQNTRKERGINIIGGNNPTAVKIQCIDTGEIFDCISDAAKSINMNRSTFDKYVKLNKPDINGNH